MRTLKRITKVGGEINDREKLLAWFNEMLDRMPNGDHLVEINPTNRTDAQNKYYWVAVRILSEALQIPQMVLHENFKSQWLPEEEYLVVVKRKKKTSTAELERDEMSEFISKLVEFAAYQNVIIPDPKNIEEL